MEATINGRNGITCREFGGGLSDSCGGTAKTAAERRRNESGKCMKMYEMQMEECFQKENM